VWPEFEPGGEDVRADLPRPRPVDQPVVDAGIEAVRQRPLATGPPWGQQGSARLGRTDVTPATRQPAREEVPCPGRRPGLQPQGEARAVHPQEAGGRQEALAALRSSPPAAGGAEGFQDGGREPAEAQEGEPLHRQPAAAVSGVLKPRATGGPGSAKRRLLGLALTRSFWQVPLARIGLGRGVSTRTVWPWSSGLAVALDPPMQAWIAARGQAVRVAVDANWRKLHQVWPAGGGGLDEQTRRPVAMSWLPTRTTGACCWFRVTLHRRGKLPRALIPAGRAMPPVGAGGSGRAPSGGPRSAPTGRPPVASSAGRAWARGRRDGAQTEHDAGGPDR
jgi:hypothetical protein